MSSVRLSQALVPAEYDIHLTPDIPGKVFTGYETIVFTKNAESEVAELAADDSIEIVKITQGEETLAFSHSDDRLEIYGPKLADAPVRIEFQGSLDHPAVGWYYVDDHCASTQFEATHARKAIPCFDDPAVKSLFKVTVTTLAEYIVLSNMPAEATVTEGNLQTVSFFKTPPMCTYLLALVIGKFDRLSGFTKRGLPVDVYAEIGKADYLKFPLEEAIKAIDWYEEYTQVNFPLPRMQLIAVPNFPFGAMENFGLLIHRETALLGKVGVSSDSALKRAALVIAHELAHQWFGDGVSPLWWQYVWLNEGFASVFPYVQFEETHPEWDIWHDFDMTDTATAMAYDSKEGTHPIDVEVESEAEIESIFDAICYSKAACVIRMLMHYIGKENMRNCLRLYLSRFMFKNAVTDDLCQAFTEGLKRDMRPFFDTWTRQSGFPLLILEDDLTIRQVRFANNGIFEDLLWLIPLEVTYCKDGKVATTKIEFSERTTKFPIDGCEWIKLNTGNHVFARVWHRGKWVEALGKAISDGKIADVDRYAVLHDAHSLSKAGLMPIGELISLLRGYSHETVFLTANVAVATFQWLYGVFESERPALKEFGLKLMHSILDAVKQEQNPNKSNENGRVRALIISALLSIGDQDVLSQLERDFAKYRDSGELDVQFVIPILIAGTRVDGGIEFIKNLVKNEVNPEIKQNAVRALGSAPIDKLPAIVDDAFSHGTVQNLSPFFYGTGETPENSAFMWTYLKDNFKMLVSRFGTTAFLLPTLLTCATRFFATEALADDIEQFAAQNKGTILDRPFAVQVEDIRTKASVAQKQAEALKAALTQ